MDETQHRVLIVEDDPVLRTRFAADIARAPAYRVAAAVGSRREALAVVAAQPLDLLVVDLGLPDGSGLDVIAALRTAQPDCAAMVVTVFGDEEHVVQAIEAGASGYLLKDADASELVEAADDLLRGGSPVSPMVARLLLQRMRSDALQPAAIARGSAPESDTRASSSPGPADAGGPSLTPREAEILALVAKGYSFAEVGRLLDITNNTIKTHVHRIYRKLAVGTRGAAVYEASRLGLIRP